MGKIKYTKTELKAQREALRRFQRFLPMLQLKKQQLQAEIQTLDTRLAERARAAEAARARLAPWAGLLAEAPGDRLNELLRLDAIVSDAGNIAGVVIPIFRDVHLTRAAYDLYDTPPWLDDALELLAEAIRVRAEMSVLERQRALIAQELRVTNQRVNLFEKVKIPECRENIRVIRIYLGDEQTAAVARGKIAKRRAPETAAVGEAAA